MRKFKCPQCGSTFSGKKDICPSCGIPLHYRDENEKAPENYDVLPSFHYDAADVMSDGIEKDEDFQKELEKEHEAKNQMSFVQKEEIPYNGESYFDGWLIQQIGWDLLGLLLIICTATIAYPWAMCFKYRWQTKHTVINGRRLQFNGKGGQLFGRYILWLFLTIVTIGIFSLWIPNKIKKWKAKHTVFAPYDERDLKAPD